MGKDVCGYCGKANGWHMWTCPELKTLWFSPELATWEGMLQGPKMKVIEEPVVITKLPEVE